MKRIYGKQRQTGMATARQPLRIGLTGGIGSGKSTAARLFSELGIPVIDTDIIARELVEPDQPALQQIVTHFGSELLQADGSLDRARLRMLIFSNPQARHDLERILHPLIRAEMRERLRKTAAPYCILEIPLLLESGWREEVDRVLVVDTPPALQRERIQSRGQLTEKEAEQIIAAQVDREQRLAAADDLLFNEGDLHELREQVKQLHTRYLEMLR